ncbi:hypothetical protein Sjap_005948 [Stephania japonica]|uniref:Uncharacterized protein n=1 Tax=Stephania japonica TaxID=461633 RepID=A0AAP0K643_9MAGN|nr:COMT protein [Stephania japonica]
MDVHEQAHLWKLIYGFVDTLVVRSAVELGILDIINKNVKPMTVLDLASKLPISNPSSDRLYRILRYLVHVRLLKVTEVDGLKRFSIQPVAKFLLRDHDKSMVPIILGMTKKDFISSWHHIKDGLSDDGSTAFDKVMGMSFFEYLQENPSQSKLFNEAMAGETRLLTASLINDCKDIFQGIESLVDIGGGNGTTIKAISDAFPHLNCSLFDLPHVVTDSNDDHPRSNAFLLILHDWSDEDCVRILKRCKEAVAKEGGKVIIVDVALEEDSKHELNNARLVLDIDMLVNTGGKERSREDWEKLIKLAGFGGYKIRHIAAIQSVIEVFP